MTPTESFLHFIGIAMAIIVFILIGYLGFKSDVLKEPGGKYSFRNFQLWIWTLLVCPIFTIHWGFHPDAAKAINLTSIILLGIPVATKLIGDVITANQISQKSSASATVIALMPATLKAQDPNSKGFFIDILSDDHGHISIGRVQNFIFTLIYIVIYVSYFFTHDKEYVNWDNDNTPFILMGISTSGYLLGKANFK